MLTITKVKLSIDSDICTDVFSAENGNNNKLNQIFQIILRFQKKAAVLSKKKKKKKKEYFPHKSQQYHHEDIRSPL